MNSILAAALALMLFAASSASAKLMSVSVEMSKGKGDQWSYMVGQGQNAKTFESDEQLAEYLAKVTNGDDGIVFSLHSAANVPAAQIIKILEMTKANQQGMTIGRIVLNDPIRR